MNRLRALIPLGIFFGLVIMLAIGLTRDPSALPSEMIDRPFPDFTLSTLHDPNRIVIETEMIGQVSLVNVFGSWCTACVIEHPKLVEIGQRENIRLIGVNWRDKRDKGQAWLSRYGDPYDITLFDDTSQLAIDLGITGAPESFIVDKSGKIRYKHTGIITDEVWSQTLRPVITQLSNAP
ncbi:MAG: DsbE family thiol:disulfide interchange protein [Alphaproteobacteria bacterium]